MADTGIIITPPKAQQDRIYEGVLLPFGGTEAASRPFIVMTVPVRLVALGLIDDDSVAVIRLLRFAPSKSWGNDGRVKEKASVFETPHKIEGKEVHLCVDNSEIVIDAAGEFFVEFVGTDRTSIAVVMMRDPVVTVTDSVRGFGAY